MVLIDKRKSQSGATLMELIIYISLMVILTGVIFGTFLAAFNSSTAAESQSNVASNGQNISQQIANDIRNSYSTTIAKTGGDVYIITQSGEDNFKAWEFDNKKVYVIRGDSKSAVQSGDARRVSMYSDGTVTIDTSDFSDSNDYKYGDYIKYGFTMHYGSFSSTLNNAVKINLLKNNSKEADVPPEVQ